MKHRIKYTQYIGLLLCLSVMSVSLSPGITDAAELGRLFSTPSERLRLNQMRNTGGMVSNPVKSQSASQMPSVGVPIRFNGFVKRSNGHSDAWINGRHAGSDRALSHKLGSGNTLRVNVPDSNRAVRMKAGQEMDPVTGKVYEVYEGQKTGNGAQSSGK